MKVINLEASIFFKEEDTGTYPAIRLAEVGEKGPVIIGYCTYHSLESLFELIRQEFEYRSKENQFEYHIFWKGNNKAIIRKIARVNW